MLVKNLKISDTLSLLADDEDEDMILQDYNGIDYTVVMNGTEKFWCIYCDHEECLPEMVYYSKHSLCEELLTKEDKNDTKKKKQSQPRQPTAYNMFLKEVLRELSETHAHLNNKDRMKLASKMWNDLKNI